MGYDRWRSMKILFLARRYSYYRNFDSVIRSLAARGHVLHLAVDRETGAGPSLVERLAAESPNITCEVLPPRAGDDWTWVAGRLRHGIEHLRYQHPMFDDTPKLRARSARRTPAGFVRLGEFLRHRATWARRPLVALLNWLERAVPENSEFRAFVQRHRPDVVLLTPLVGLGSQQIDYLRAARSLNIPTGLAVWSWDHLSSKALIRELPDRVFVWNHTQKREAVEYHGVPEDRIAVTGAQCFDRWFGRLPSRDRHTLCQAIGLTPVRPFILYVCSSPFLGSQPEAPFVVEWVRRVRESAGVLREVPILIRPHPTRQAEWAEVDVSSFRDVVVWGSNPVDPASRNDYFDSLYHSAAVVGLNTSAFIEAGIVGRPVLTILLPEWYENQLGTVHFRYLFEAGGGLLVSARSFDEHLAQLEQAVGAPPAGRRPFVREFVRPHGLDVPATPIFVERVEAMEGLKVSQPDPPPLLGLARRLLAPMRAWRHDPHRERLVYAEAERDTVRRMRASRRAKAERDKALKNLRVRERAARGAARQEELQQFRAAKRAREKAAGRRAAR
jgi:hypothetical protein